jgi:hypothetical protein
MPARRASKQEVASLGRGRNRGWSQQTEFINFVISIARLQNRDYKRLPASAPHFAPFPLASHPRSSPPAPCSSASSSPSSPSQYAQLTRARTSPTDAPVDRANHHHGKQHRRRCYACTRAVCHPLLLHCQHLRAALPRPQSDPRNVSRPPSRSLFLKQAQVPAC